MKPKGRPKCRICGHTHGTGICIKLRGDHPKIVQLSRSGIQFRVNNPNNYRFDRKMNNGVNPALKHVVDISNIPDEIVEDTLLSAFTTLGISL